MGPILMIENESSRFESENDWERNMREKRKLGFENLIVSPQDNTQSSFQSTGAGIESEGIRLPKPIRTDGNG